jgi:hypothetical protein
LEDIFSALSLTASRTFDRDDERAFDGWPNAESHRHRAAVMAAKIIGLMAAAEKRQRLCDDTSDSPLNWRFLCIVVPPLMSDG